MPGKRCELRLLVRGVSLGSKSLKNRLALLASRTAEAKGIVVDRALMEDFACPFYDSDLEAETGIPAGRVRT